MSIFVFLSLQIQAATTTHLFVSHAAKECWHFSPPQRSALQAGRSAWTHSTGDLDGGLGKQGVPSLESQGNFPISIQQLSSRVLAGGTILHCLIFNVSEFWGLKT